LAAVNRGKGRKVHLEGFSRGQSEKYLRARWNAGIPALQLPLRSEIGQRCQKLMSREATVLLPERLNGIASPPLTSAATDSD